MATNPIIQDALASGVPPELLYGARKTRYGWFTGTATFKNPLLGKMPKSLGDLSNWQVYGTCPDGQDCSLWGNAVAIENADGTATVGNPADLTPFSVVLDRESWRSGVYPGGPNEAAWDAIPVNATTIAGINADIARGAKISFSDIRNAVEFVGGVLLLAAGLSEFIPSGTEAGAVEDAGAGEITGTPVEEVPPTEGAPIEAPPPAEPLPTPPPIIAPPPTTGSEIGGGISEGVGAGVGEATGVAGSSISDIVSSVEDTLSSLKDFISNVLGPISDTIHAVAAEVQDINDNLIQPIVGPIKSILDNYKALSAELTRDLHTGVQGLLRVPQDLANALSSVDATMQRSVERLGAVNREVVHEELGPGVGAGVSLGFDHSAAALNDGLDKYNGSEFDPQIKHIHDDATIADIAAIEAKILGWADKEFPLVGKIGSWVVDGVLSLLLLLSYLESKSALYKHIGRLKFPSELLDPENVREAMRRGILSESEGNTELGKHGLNEDRRKVLEELDRQLPSESDALTWRAREEIDDQGLQQILSARGWREDDQARLRNAHRLLADPTAVLRWWKRGFIPESEVRAILAAFDYRPADIERLIADSWLQWDAPSVIAAADRSALADANVARETTTGDAPHEVADALAQIGLPPEVANLIWRNHFQVLAPELAVQGLFRGYLSNAQTRALLQAAGIAPEQWQNFIDLNRPILTVRQIPHLLSLGFIDEGKAQDMLRANGYSDPDALLVLKLATHTGRASGAVSGAELHGLTVGAVLQLYDAGTINAEHATTLLHELSVGTEATPLLLQLSDIRRELAGRKAHAELIIARARAGQLSYDEAQSELHASGLTTAEAERALAVLERDLAAHVKLPGEAEVVNMYSHSIIDRDEAASTLKLLGYSAEWAERLIQLKEATHGGGSKATSGAPQAASAGGGAGA